MFPIRLGRRRSPPALQQQPRRRLPMKLVRRSPRLIQQRRTPNLQTITNKLKSKLISDISSPSYSATVQLLNQIRYEPSPTGDCARSPRPLLSSSLRPRQYRERTKTRQQRSNRRRSKHRARWRRRLRHDLIPYLARSRPRRHRRRPPAKSRRRVNHPSRTNRSRAIRAFARERSRTISRTRKRPRTRNASAAIRNGSTTSSRWNPRRKRTSNRNRR